MAKNRNKILLKLDSRIMKRVVQSSQNPQSSFQPFKVNQWCEMNLFFEYVWYENKECPCTRGSKCTQEHRIAQENLELVCVVSYKIA